MKESILFLNNQEIKDLGGEDMQAVLHDCQRAYVLMEEGDVLAPTKCVMRWGKTPEDENVLGRINAVPASSISSTIRIPSSRSASLTAR